MRWDEMTTAQFAARDFWRTVAILTVAATEPHRPHLPVATDSALGEAILARLPDDPEALILPMPRVGKSDEPLAFKGTLTICAETLRQVWLDLARSVARAGARRLILFNSHGGQVGLVDIVCRHIRIELGTLAVGCSWFRLVDLDDIVGADEIRHSTHGGDVETSMMLAIAAAGIDMRQAQNFTPLTVEIERSGSPLTAEGRVGFGWQAQDLPPSGGCGDASLATPEKGRAALDRAAAALARLIEAARAIDLSRLTSVTAFDR